VEKARRLVADLIEASPEDIVLDAQQGRFHVAGAPQSGLSWASLPRVSTATAASRS